MTRSTATVMTDSSPEPEVTSRSATWAGAPRHWRRRGRAASKTARISAGTPGRARRARAVAEEDARRRADRVVDGLGAFREAGHLPARRVQRGIGDSSRGGELGVAARDEGERIRVLDEAPLERRRHAGERAVVERRPE